MIQSKQKNNTIRDLIFELYQMSRKDKEKPRINNSKFSIYDDVVTYYAYSSQYDPHKIKLILSQQQIPKIGYRRFNLGKFANIQILLEYKDFIKIVQNTKQWKAKFFRQAVTFIRLCPPNYIYQNRNGQFSQQMIPIKFSLYQKNKYFQQIDRQLRIKKLNFNEINKKKMKKGSNNLIQNQKNLKKTKQLQIKIQQLEIYQQNEKKQQDSNNLKNSQKCKNNQGIKQLFTTQIFKQYLQNDSIPKHTKQKLFTILSSNPDSKEHIQFSIIIALAKEFNISIIEAYQFYFKTNGQLQKGYKIWTQVQDEAIINNLDFSLIFQMEGMKMTNSRKQFLNRQIKNRFFDIY